MVIKSYRISPLMIISNIVITLQGKISYTIVSRDVLYLSLFAVFISCLCENDMDKMLTRCSCNRLVRSNRRRRRASSWLTWAKQMRRQVVSQPANRAKSTRVVMPVDLSLGRFVIVCQSLSLSFSLYTINTTNCRLIQMRRRRRASRTISIACPPHCRFETPLASLILPPPFATPVLRRIRSAYNIIHHENHDLLH